MGFTLRTAAAIGAITVVAACSQPAEEAAVAPAYDPAATADASPSAGTMPGGMVSPPASNEAINMSGPPEGEVAAASTSFTEGQARDHLRSAGYTDVQSLAKTPDGLWTAKAMKDGKSFDLALDFKGAITAR